MGGAIGVAIYSTILSDTYKSQLVDNVAAVARNSPLPGSEAAALVKAASVNTTAAYKAVPGITDSIISMCRLAVKYAYAHAFGIVWYSALAFGVVALISAFFIRSIPPELKTGERAVHLEDERSAVASDIEKRHSAV